MSETGVAELLNFVFNQFNTHDQQSLANNIFLTGGCSQLPGISIKIIKIVLFYINIYILSKGLKNRLLKELQEMRPFNSSFAVKESKNPTLDAWCGAKDLANSLNFKNMITKKIDFLKNGAEYFKDFPTSNKCLLTPKNISN